MNKLALALSLLGLAGSAHAAAPKSIVAMSARSQKAYIKAQFANGGAKTATTSLAHTVLAATAKNARAKFHIYKIEGGLDFGAKAYEPKIEVKGLNANTAYIVSGTVMGPKFVSTVQLPES